MDAMGRGPGICFCRVAPPDGTCHDGGMAGTPTFPLYDQITGGRLDQLLDGYRNDGLGSRAIAVKLGEDHNILVSYRTVARWMADR